MVAALLLPAFLVGPHPQAVVAAKREFSGAAHLADAFRVARIAADDLLEDPPALVVEEAQAGLVDHLQTAVVDAHSHGLAEDGAALDVEVLPGAGELEARRRRRSLVAGHHGGGPGFLDVGKGQTHRRLAGAGVGLDHHVLACGRGRGQGQGGEYQVEAVFAVGQGEGDPVVPVEEFQVGRHHRQRVAGDGLLVVGRRQIERGHHLLVGDEGLGGHRRLGEVGIRPAHGRGSGIVADEDARDGIVRGAGGLVRVGLEGKAAHLQLDGHARGRRIGVAVVTAAGVVGFEVFGVGPEGDRPGKRVAGRHAAQGQHAQAADVPRQEEGDRFRRLGLGDGEGRQRGGDPADAVGLGVRIRGSGGDVLPLFAGVVQQG